MVTVVDSLAHSTKYEGADDGGYEDNNGHVRRRCHGKLHNIDDGGYEENNGDVMMHLS